MPPLDVVHYAKRIWNQITHLTGYDGKTAIPAAITQFDVELTFNPADSHNDGLDISTVKTLSPPASATKLMIQATAQNVRITLDGTDPSATKGFQLPTGSYPVVFTVGPASVFKVIEEAATADLQYQWGN